MNYVSSVVRWLYLAILVPVFSATVAAQNADEASSPAPAATPNPAEAIAPMPADPGVAVDRFEFSYGLTLPDLPPLDELKSLTMALTRDGNVFRAPAESGGVNIFPSFRIKMLSPVHSAT